jgi:hypothetical protein
MVQVVEHLPGKCKALSSKPKYYKEREREREMMVIWVYSKDIAKEEK